MLIPIYVNQKFRVGNLYCYIYAVQYSTAQYCTLFITMPNWNNLYHIVSTRIKWGYLGITDICTLYSVKLSTINCTTLYLSLYSTVHLIAQFRLNTWNIFFYISLHFTANVSIKTCGSLVFLQLLCFQNSSVHSSGSFDNLKHSLIQITISASNYIVIAFNFWHKPMAVVEFQYILIWQICLESVISWALVGRS